MPDSICHKTEIIDGTVSYSETFDPDYPTLMDCHPSYDMDKSLGDRPTTLIQREVCYKLKKAERQSTHLLKSNMSAIPDEGKQDVKYQYLTKT